MFKTFNTDIWVFDVKWGPESDAGRRHFELPKETSDQED